MPRFRFFTKKRGDRRTISDVGGRAALAGFFVLLLVVGGSVLAVVLGKMTAPEWRANHEFAETTAVVLDKKVGEWSGAEQTKYRPEVTVRYTVADREYVVAAYDATGIFLTDRAACERLLDEFEIGHTYACWYDPQAPDRAVLIHGYSWYAWVLPLLPAAFVAVGFGGIAYVFLTWGKSVEHRALMSQAANIDLFDPRSTGRRYPAVPDDGDAAGSPGTTLKYRIPIAALGWNTMFLSLVALGWNLLVGWFAYRAVGEALEGKTDYLLWIGLVPFLVAGGYLAYLAGRQLMIASGIEPTLVEISDHPLYPGGCYEVFVSQSGRMHFQRLSLALVCDEEATFRQGTNSRTHSQRVLETEVFRRDEFLIERREPFNARFDLRIPDGAMHSFQSPHNSVKWKLLVRGALHNWPDFERAYALTVYPGRNGAPRT